MKIYKELSEKEYQERNLFPSQLRWLLFGSISLAALCFQTLAYSQTALPTPYTHYTFDDNTASLVVLDSATGNNALLSQNTSTMSVVGKIDRAFSFNGTSQYGDLANVFDFIRNDNQGTFSLWVKPVDGFPILGFTGPGGYFSVEWYKSNQSVTFYVAGAGGNPISCTTATGSMPANVFSHLVITQDGSQFKIYINGVEQNNLTYWSKNNPGAWLSFLTGSVNSGRLASVIDGRNQYFLNGVIDDVQYYKRALTTEEVLAIYNAATPTVLQPTLTFNSSASSVLPGGSVNLNWSSSNATGCTASGSWSGTKDLSGSQSITNITTASNYTLTCTGDGGSVSSTQSVSLQTTPPVISDTTKPEIAIVSPVSGRSYSVGTAITASVNATDNVGVTKVELYINSKLTQTKTTPTWGSYYSFNIPTGSFVAGAYTIRILVYDKAGNTASASATISLEGELVPGSSTKPVMTSSLTAAGTVGANFTYQIIATQTPTSYGASGLPGGLSINTTSGLISGNPTTAKVSNIIISATNSLGTTTATLILTVSAAPTSAVNGMCGSADGTARSTAPAGNLLCSQGTASAVSGTGPWTWNCAGSNGGQTDPCSATLLSASRDYTTTFSGRGYYVDSQNGNDINAGTLAAPWKTLARAQRATYAAGDALLLKCDTTFRETLKITSAMAPNGLTVGNYGSNCSPDTRPVISGSDLVNTNWSDDPTDTKVKMVSVEGPIKQVYYKGNLLVKARHPDFGGVGHEFGNSIIPVTNDADPYTFKVSASDADLFNNVRNPMGAAIYVKTFPFSVEPGKVTGYNFSTKQLTFVADSKTGLFRKPGEGSGYILEGARWMLNAPNEWYYDTTNRKLSVILPNGEVPASGTIEVARGRDILISIEGAKNITIEKLAIINGSETGVQVNGGMNVTLRELALQYHKKIAIDFLKGTNVRLENSTIVDSALTAIRISADTDQAIVLNNTISDTGMGPYTGSFAAISVGGIDRSGGASFEIRDNNISRSGRNAIGWARNIERGLISGNIIEDSCQRLGDCGAIYISRTVGNLKIEKNFIRGVTATQEGAQRYKGNEGYGIYLDSQASNIISDRNIIAEATKGFNIHMGDGNVVSNNVFFANEENALQFNAVGGVNDEGPFIQENNTVDGNYFFAMKAGTNTIMRVRLVDQPFAGFTKTDGNVVQNSKIIIGGSRSALKWVTIFKDQNKDYMSITAWKAVEKTVSEISRDAALEEIDGLGLKKAGVDFLIQQTR